MQNTPSYRSLSALSEQRYKRSTSQVVWLVLVTVIVGTSVAEVTDRPGAVSPMALAAQTSPATPGFLSSADKTQTSDGNLKASCTQYSCSSCSGSNPSYCYTCNSGYYLTGGYCYSCAYSCNTCSSYSTCSSCSYGYSLRSGQCYSSSNSSNSDSRAGELFAEVVAAVCVACCGFICKFCCDDNRTNNAANPTYQSGAFDSATTFSPQPGGPSATAPNNRGYKPSAPSPIVVQGRPTFSPGMSSMPSNFEALRAPLVVGQPSNRYNPPAFEFINMETRPQGYDYPRGSN